MRLFALCLVCKCVFERPIATLADVLLAFSEPAICAKCLEIQATIDPEKYDMEFLASCGIAREEK
jgi:hypothetical protein